MKNFYSFLIIMIFFISCTNEMDFLPKDGAVSGTIKAEPTNRGILEMPANSDNPYDAAGRLHTDLFDAYYVSENLPSSISDIADRVELIANANSEFTGIKPPDYHAVSSDRVQYILSHSSTCVSEIIDASDMTTNAKSSLSIFINSLSILFAKEESSEALYNFVADYEAIVVNDSQLTEEDKRIILTTSSIARYSTCRVLKRPKKNTDPNWILTVGNIIAGTDGASYSTAEAITMALATGIAENQ